MTIKYITDLPTISESIADGDYFIVENVSETSSHRTSKVAASVLATYAVAAIGTSTFQATDTDLTAIAAISTGSTGMLAKTGDGTWSVRTITGTSAEITVTNGSGVSGAPTLSLPTALTFTGKTITGGTYSSPTLTTPTLGVAKGTNLVLSDNTTTPSAPTTPTLLYIAAANTTQTSIIADSFGTSGPNLALRSIGGTAASKTATVSGTSLGGIVFGGYGATGLTATLVGINATAAETFTDTAQGAYAEILTTTIGTAGSARVSRVRFEASGGITVPPTVTGGNQGVGTVNAIGLYVAGAAVATTTDTQALTNKTINLSSNTLTGTTAQFNTALSDGDFATLAGSEALTNKTIGSTNTVTLKDTLFTVQDDGDATKLFALQLSGITTGNTRTWTVPDSSDTFVGKATTDELTNKTLNASVGKGTWTASGTWTLPALTLGGAITYGGVTLSNAVTGTGNMVLSAGPTFTGTVNSAAHVITSAGANAFAVGPAGTTNPTLQVDASTASAATGLKIKSAAAAAGLALSVITSGTNEALTIDAAGSGTITLGGTSTGAIALTRATTISAALTYGGVALSNAVTGTGNMVLSASPTLTGTVNAAALVLTSAGANALAVGPAGSTNPTIQLDASTASAATGLKVKSAAAAAGLALSVITSGTNENLTIDAAGSGTITLGGTSTGAIIHTRASTFSAAITYGGVALSNAVTGTGNMVLSTSPTIAGGAHTAITGLGIRSTGAAFDLTIASTEVFTAGRTLTVAMGDAARTITFSGNPTLADWFDQSVKIAATPTYAGLSISGNTGLKVIDTDASHYLTIAPGTNLSANRTFTLTTGDAARTLDISAADTTISSFAATYLDDTTAKAFRATTGTLHEVQIKVINDATTLTTGEAKLIFLIPTNLNGLDLLAAHAAVSTVSSSGLPTIAIRNITNSNVDMLSTSITIDANEFTSYTAATAPVINTSNDNVATGDLIAIDVDVAGTGAGGLIVNLTFG